MNRQVLVILCTGFLIVVSSQVVLSDNKCILQNECKIDECNVAKKNNSSTSKRTLFIDEPKKVVDFNEPQIVQFKSLDEFMKPLSELLAPLNFNRPGISERCQLQGKLFLKELDKFSLWALQMYDSSGKIPPGLLSGNNHQLGDFDQCMELKSIDNMVENDEENGAITGKYCLSNIQITPPTNPYGEYLFKRIHAHFPFVSNLTDISHIVPRLSSTNWGWCVPAACSYKDVEIVVDAVVQSVATKLGLEVESQVEPHMCTSRIDQKWPLKGIIAASIFSIFITFILGVSLYDYMIPETDSNLMAFSLIRNWTKLFSTDRSSEDIPTVHGMKFFNMALLLFAHKGMSMFYDPFINRNFMTTVIGHPWTVTGRSASMYTDSFIMFSSLLTSYTFFGYLYSKQKINVRFEIVARLFRIIPTLAAVIGFSTLVLPYTNSGPMWGMTVLKPAQICEANWWKSFLFISNYYGFRDMCFMHTHHVGIDMHFFFITPLVVWALWKWPKRTSLAMVATGVVSCIVRYNVAYTMGLHNYVFFGASVNQLMDTADYIYTLPFYRIPVYVMGILLGYALRAHKDVIIKPKLLFLGNVVAFIIYKACFLIPSPMGDMLYKFLPVHGAIYAAVVPVFWCYVFCWIIFTAQYGYENIASRFFSHRLFLIQTRISYAVYLTQYPVFFYYVGLRRAAESYEFAKIHLNPTEMVHIFIISIIVTLLFDIPFQNLRHIIYKKPKDYTEVCDEKKEEIKSE